MAAWSSIPTWKTPRAEESVALPRGGQNWTHRHTLKRLKMFSFCLCFMCCLCGKHCKPMTVVRHIDDCAGWAPRLCVLDFTIQPELQTRSQTGTRSRVGGLLYTTAVFRSALEFAAEQTSTSAQRLHTGSALCCSRCVVTRWVPSARRLGGQDWTWSTSLGRLPSQNTASRGSLAESSAWTPLSFV